MLCDLNVVWPKDASVGYTPPSVNKTLAILQDLGYTTVALNCILTGKIPNGYKCPFDISPVQDAFPGLKLLSRVTLVLDDSSQHQNFSGLQSQFDIISVRPMSEKSLQSACSSLEIDLISLDFSRRLPFFLRHKTVCSAVDRGVKFEICYGPSSLSTDGRRHVITNACALIRASRSRGIIVSSEATTPLACRGPYDVTNLATLWGLDHMRARDSVGKTAELVVQNSFLRNHSYKQVVAIPEERTSSLSSKKRQSLSTLEPDKPLKKKKN